ncbi:MAG: hypothetical protein HOM19_11610 [Candidatus Marinimicrobia bacterium]|nr:hypothetical protein [Candidatus Neomarinimicrobiota bacterium]
MSQIQKQVLKIDDLSVIKILDKPFTKQIINCFEDAPKTASEIAHAVAFPKDKIYYHLKKLLAVNIIFISETEIVKGIEQKRFLPVAKHFEIKYTENKSPLKSISEESAKEITDPNNHITDLENNKSVKLNYIKRNIIDRRRSNDRRNDDNPLTVNDHGSKNKRSVITRRGQIERRISTNVFDSLIYEKEEIKKPFKSKIKSQRINNYLLNLNGITQAMTFVYTGNTVTFMQATLNNKGFNIDRIRNYQFPIKIDNHEIKTLPELIINVYQQYIEKSKRKNIYLAIHSDSYQYEMTYLKTEEKQKDDFENLLVNNLSKLYSIEPENSMMEFEINNTNVKNAIVCYSSKKSDIDQDYQTLVDSGLQPRYNTSIPKLLQNIYNYYSLEKNDGYALLIYIDRFKTHIVLIQENQLIESRYIHIGLNYFISRLSKLASGNLPTEEARSNALHFLENYGISKTKNKFELQGGFPYDDARLILNELSSIMMNQLKDSINNFSIIPRAIGDNNFVFGGVYIGGPGSHIKNMDRLISDTIGNPVEKLNSITTTSFKKINDSKRDILTRVKENYILNNKKRSENKLKDVQDKIQEQKKAIEMSKSPESAKYRLTRLEIDKNSKLKSIDEANQKLILTAKEFKELKVEYMDGQDTLTADLDAVTTQVENKSESLLDNYKEHDYLIKKISEMEYETDHFQKKREEAGRKSKGEYELQIKKAAKSRISLTERKELYEHEIDELQTKILKVEDTRQEMAMKLGTGHDEIAILEYLKDAVHNTAKLFKKSFLENLKFLVELGEEDVTILQQAEYLLSQNTERLKGIKKSFEEIVSGEAEYHSSQYLDADNGFDTRRKLLTVLDVVLQTPNNLEEIKKLTSDIVKVNIEQQDLIQKGDKLQDQVNASRQKRKKKEGKLSFLKKEIDIYLNDLKENKIKLQEILDVVDFNHETIDMIKDLNIKEDEIIDLQPQQKTIKKELNILDNELLRLNSAIEICEININGHIDSNSKLTNTHEEKSKILKDLSKQLIIQQKDLEEMIRGHSQKDISVIEEINDTKDTYAQLEKQKAEGLKAIEELNEQYIPLVTEAEEKKKKFQKVLSRKLKKLQKEQNKKITEAQEIKEVTIKAFFKKERTTLAKKQKSIETNLAKSTKEIEKLIVDRDRKNSSLAEKKKKKLSQISGWEKDIKSWYRDLKRGHALQQRLDILEDKKSEWESLLEKERNKSEEQNKVLEKNILRKQSNSYLLFLQDGFVRLKKDVDPVAAAQALADESIVLDREEIVEVNLVFERIEKRYQTFMIRYRSNSKKILTKLKPHGGRKKTITAKIVSAEKKIATAEKIIQNLKDKLDQKNSLLSKKEIEFLQLNKNVKYKINSIQLEIDQIPIKEARSQKNITTKLEEILAEISNKINIIKNEHDQAVRPIEEALEQQDVIIDMKELKQQLKSDDDELKKIQNQLEFLKEKKEKSPQVLSGHKENLKKVLIKITKTKSDIKNQQDEFQEQEKELIFFLEKNKKDLVQHQEDHHTIKENMLELERSLRKLDEIYNDTLSEIQTLNNKIKIPNQEMVSISKIPKRNQKNKKIKNDKDQLQTLVNMGQDLLTHVAHLEKTINDLNEALDTMRGQESEIENSLKLIDNDLETFQADLEKIEKLKKFNNNNIEGVKGHHQDVLARLNHIKDIYPPIKTMLNERVEELHNLIEIKTKEKNKLDTLLQDMEKDLKDKRVEIAILDKELSRVNKDMKKVLEYSIYEQEPTTAEDEWLWNIPENKMRSYMDLADMKTRSKVLFNEIIQTEQDIAQLQKKKSSIQYARNESEKISQKKIKNMEDLCNRLELQITKEKNDIEDLEKSLNGLKGHSFNYGNRIEILEKELKEFRDREIEYELILKDLDRSLDRIQNKYQQVAIKDEMIKKNTIELDYTANLGLLMDPYSKLNLLPVKHKEEYRYFATNRILQNALLVLVMVCSLAAYAQRSKIEPLEASLPNKYSELSLLTMRQEIKEIVENQNSVANTFQELINEDKTLSTNMVAMLKYLSNKIPDSFRVTELALNKIISSHLANDRVWDKLTKSGDPKLIITLNGFYNQNLEQASTLVTPFRTSLESSGWFDIVDFSNGQEINNGQTSFSINLVL